MPPRDIVAQASAALSHFFPGAEWKRAFTAWLVNQTSQNTKIAYTYAWRNFLNVAKCNIADVTQDHVLVYKEHLVRFGYSPASINQHLAALGSFYDYCIHQRKPPMRIENPVEGVKRLPVEKYGKAQVLDIEQNEHIRLIKHIINDESAPEELRLRDAALVILTLSTAVRVDVLANLTLANLEIIDERVIMHYKYKGKTEISRSVELPDVAVNALQRYFSVRADNLTPESPVFKSVSSDKGIDAVQIWRRVKKHCQDAGLGDKYPHSLRHTGIQIADAQGWSTGDLMAFSGHSNPGSLYIYLHAIKNKKTAGKVAAQVGKSILEGLENEM